MPPNDMYPEAFADQAWEWAKELRQRPSHHHQLRPSYQKAGMGGLVAVGMGSSRKPCMVIFELDSADKKGRGPMLGRQGHHLRHGRYLPQAWRKHGRNEVRHGRLRYRLRDHASSRCDRLRRQGHRHHLHGRKHASSKRSTPRRRHHNPLWKDH